MLLRNPALAPIADALNELEATGEATEALTLPDAADSDDCRALQLRCLEFGAAVRELEADEEAIDAEIKRLQDLKKTTRRRVEYLTGAVAEAMQFRGIQKIESPLLTLSFRKSSAVEIPDSADVPDEFCRIKTTREPDKAVIARILKAGDEVPGCKLVERQNLQVK